MTLDLHANLKARLVDSLAEGIPHLTVTNGMFMKREGTFAALSPAERALPEHGQIRNRLIRYIDEYPIVEFVSDVLADELLELWPAPGLDDTRLS